MLFTIRTIVLLCPILIDVPHTHTDGYTYIHAHRRVGGEDAGLYEADAEVTFRNGQDFEARSQRINATTDALVRCVLCCDLTGWVPTLGRGTGGRGMRGHGHQNTHKHHQTEPHQVDWLAAQPGVRAVFYPRLTQRPIYDAYKRPEGGYGGLFSVSLEEGLSPTAFYDALDVYKGPSLGTNYTLACPYTLLVRAWPPSILAPNNGTDSMTLHHRGAYGTNGAQTFLLTLTIVNGRRTTASWTSPRLTACAPTSYASPSASRRWRWVPCVDVVVA